MTNQQNSETGITAVDSGTLNRKKCVDKHGQQKHDGKINCVILTDTETIPDIHVKLFSVTRTINKDFKVISEGKSLILNKPPPNLFLIRK